MFHRHYKLVRDADRTDARSHVLLRTLYSMKRACLPMVHWPTALLSVPYLHRSALVQTPTAPLEAPPFAYLIGRVSN